MRRILSKIYFKYSGYIFRIFPGLIGFLLPKTLVVEASNICMLKCPACATVNTSLRKRGKMDFSTFKLLLDNIGWKLKRINFSFAGEPLVNPEIFKMVSYAKERNIECIIETNGMLLGENIDELLSCGLFKLNIVFDGIDQQSIAKYRKGIEFEKLVDAVRRLTQEKLRRGLKNPEIHLQFIVMRHNENQINKAIEAARELKADFIDFKSMILSGGLGLNSEEKENLAKEYLPQSQQFLRYEQINGKWHLKKSRSCFCPHLLSSAVIMWNGDVTICTMDVNGDFLVGNIFELPLQKIWQSKRYMLARKNAIRKEIAACCDCAYLVDDVLVLPLGNQRV